MCGNDKAASDGGKNGKRDGAMSDFPIELLLLVLLLLPLGDVDGDEGNDANDDGVTIEGDDS